MRGVRSFQFVCLIGINPLRALCGGFVKEIKNSLFGTNEDHLRFQYFKPDYLDWPGPAHYQFSKLIGTSFRSPLDGEEFEYIVVGGGASGCPLARTLAENGHKTILLERGSIREKNHLTWAADGTGRTFNDKRLSQPFVTTEGTISHVANTLGGGTAINFGFYIEENEIEFDSSHPHSNALSKYINTSLWRDAEAWVRDQVARQTTLAESYGDSMRNFMNELIGAANHTPFSARIIDDGTWKGFTIFDSKENNFRRSADTLLGRVGVDFPGQLTVALNSEVKTIEVDKKSSHGQGDIKASARCVTFLDGVTEAPTPILSRPGKGVGIFWSHRNLLEWIKWFPTLNWFVERLWPQSNIKETPTKTVCLNESSTHARVILSAGAVMTPWILYNSGIGPASEIHKLNIELRADVPELGRNLLDRVFFPLALFLKDGNFDGRQIRPITMVNAIALTRQKEKRSMILSGEGAEHTSQSSGPAEESRCARLLQAYACNSPDDSACADVNLELSRQQNYSIKTENVSSAFEEISGGKILEGTLAAVRYFVPPALRGSLIVDLAMEVLGQCGEEQQLRVEAARANKKPPIFLALCSLARPILRCIRSAAAIVWLLPQPKSRGRIFVGGPDSRSLQIEGNYWKDPRDQKNAVAGLSMLFRALARTNAFDGVFQEVDKTAAMKDAYQDSCPMMMKTSLAKLLEMVGSIFGEYIAPREVKMATEAIFKSNDIDALLLELGSILGGDLGNMTLDSLEALLTQLPSSNHPEIEMKVSKLSQQRYLTFPPLLPHEDDFQAISRFAQDHSSSMWHWTGSAAMGLVTDPDDFRIISGELDRLAIADASVFPELTRMNPEAAVMALGRYAGMKILQARRAREE